MVEIQRLRQRRWTGTLIAEAVGLSRATVARTLAQLGLARLPSLEAATVGRRYEWERPGQLVHVDIKKLGRIGGIGHRITGDRRQRVRGIGWEFVHVCLDDCSRLAYAEVLSDEQSVTVAGFLRRAVAWFARRGVRAQRVLSDNGSAYRSRLVAAACQALTLDHRFTRPYTPAYEWQGRALHPGPAARVGVRGRLPVLGAPHRRAEPLAALLQLASAAHGPAPSTAHQQSRRSGRSIETSHLDRIQSSTLAGAALPGHYRRMPSRWCAWCGKPVTVGVVIARTVVYHECCWWRRASVLDKRDEHAPG